MPCDCCSRHFGDVVKEMTQNEIEMENGVYGMAGWQSNGTLPDFLNCLGPACGQWLNKQRPMQILFLEEMIARTKDPTAKTRLERALKPWKAWSGEPRFGRSRSLNRPSRS